MTKQEYTEILNAISTVEENEKHLCKRYCELNPADRERREHDRDILIFGLMRARFEIERRFKKEV